MCVACSDNGASETRAIVSRGRSVNLSGPSAQELMGMLPSSALRETPQTGCNSHIAACRLQRKKNATNLNFLDSVRGILGSSAVKVSSRGGLNVVTYQVARGAARLVC